MNKKQNYIYIGVDTHKETHTAVIMDCWNDILGKKTFENKVNDFAGLLNEVKKHCEGLTPVFGLEDVNGFGRRLAVFLIDNGYIVKAVNPALAKWFRDSAATTEKNDEYDAFSIACVLLTKLDKLPAADPQDLYWTLRQLVGRRDSLVFVN